jgi:hypothetical protein
MRHSKTFSGSLRKCAQYLFWRDIKGDIVVSLLILLLILLTGPVIKAQSNATKENPSPTPKDEKGSKSVRKGSITGRVVGEDGNPLLDAEVRVMPFSDFFSQQSVLTVDKEGNFRADNLRASSYTVSASAPGYTSAPEEDSPERKLYRIGDSVYLRLVKGGVITGTVTDENGEPLISVRLRAVRVRDSAGHKTELFGRFSASAMTDDRGIYRFYGLPAGTYIVMAGGSEGYYFGDSVGAESPPIFYPSSTADSASEITVQSGQETSGIDIRFRTLLGHNIIGVISNAKTFLTGPSLFAYIILTNSNTRIEATSQNAAERDGKFAFSFGNIADGDYEIQAMIYKDRDILAASQTQKVTVKGADVGGLVIQLFKQTSLSGRIVLAANKDEKKDPACNNNRPFSFDEFVLQLPRNEKETSLSFWLVASGELGVSADETGAFTLKNLRAGKRRVVVKLPGDNLFVRSITGPAVAPGKQPFDIARNGITLKAGEQAKDVTVTIAEGAATLSGKVVSSDDNAIALPENLLVHLVPGEKEAADEALRYFETNPESDGSFSITNIPPGRYFVLIRPMKADEERETFRRPVAWDDLQRARLRREAEAANQTIELSQCKRVADFVLRVKQ